MYSKMRVGAGCSTSRVCIAMSIVEKVAALRSFFGLTAEMALPLAILSMNEMMGIVGEGPLAAQVDILVAKTGLPNLSLVHVDLTGSSSSTQPSGSAPSSASAPVSPSTGTPSGASAQIRLPAVVGKKRSHDGAPTGRQWKQQCSMGSYFQKVVITAEELRKQREASSRGVAYSPRKFTGPGEVSKCEELCAPAVAKEFRCPMCPRKFGHECALTSHVRAHGESVNEKEFFFAPRPSPPQLIVKVGLTTTASTVKVTIFIGGKTCEERVSTGQCCTPYLHCVLHTLPSLRDFASLSRAGSTEGSRAGSTE